MAVPTKATDKSYYRQVVRGKSMNPLLYDLLSRATPHGHEHRIHDLFPNGFIKDDKGNLIYYRGDKKVHKTIFSSHMDTVHKNPDDLLIVERLDKKEPSGIMYGSTLEQAACVLGADDKIGVYIMLRMLEKNIPGIYIFHVGEECGCVGSNWILKNNTQLYTGIDRIIAFDRMGYGDIITHQRGQRCCSDEFANALAAQLNKNLPPKQKMGPTKGVYTDSAVYMNDVPECTNISVGYFSQHTSDERFDHVWLEGILLPAILQVDWSALPTKRDPSVKEYGHWEGSYKNYNVGTTTTNIYKSWGAITRSTDWKNIPYWDITKGLPDGATREAIMALLTKKFGTIGLDSLCRDVFTLMEKVTLAEAEKKKLQEEIDAKEKEIVAMINYADMYYDYAEPKTIIN